MESNEIKIAILQTQMTEIKEKVEQLDEKVDEGFLHLEKIIKEALAGKADIWVEQAIRTALYIIVSTVIIGLLALLGLKGQL